METSGSHLFVATWILLSITAFVSIVPITDFRNYRSATTTDATCSIYSNADTKVVALLPPTKVTLRLAHGLFIEKVS